jgi:hypothetical protein
MPDRYGDSADRDTDYAPTRSPSQAPNHSYEQVQSCRLCDENGLCDGFACDHIDYSEARKRGMDMIRRAMGWERR